MVTGHQYASIKVRVGFYTELFNGIELTCHWGPAWICAELGRVNIQRFWSKNEYSFRTYSTAEKTDLKHELLSWSCVFSIMDVEELVVLGIRIGAHFELTRVSPLIILVNTRLLVESGSCTHRLHSWRTKILKNLWPPWMALYLFSLRDIIQ